MKRDLPVFLSILVKYAIQLDEFYIISEILRLIRQNTINILRNTGIFTLRLTLTLLE